MMGTASSWIKAWDQGCPDPALEGRRRAGGRHRFHLGIRVPWRKPFFLRKDRIVPAGLRPTRNPDIDVLRAKRCAYMLNHQKEHWLWPPQEVESVDTHQDVPIGIDLEKVSIQRVKHQASEENTHTHTRTSTVTTRVVLYCCSTSAGRGHVCEPTWSGRTDRRQS